MADKSDAEARSDFGADLGAAIRYWAKYDGFPEGVNLAHQVLGVLETHLGAVRQCFTTASNQYVAVRLDGHGPTMMTVEGGRIYVTPPAVNAFAACGKQARSELIAAGINAVANVDGEGLDIWNSRGTPGRSSPSAQKGPAARICRNPQCANAFLAQPSAKACEMCGQPLS